MDLEILIKRMTSIIKRKFKQRVNAKRYYKKNAKVIITKNSKTSKKYWLEKHEHMLNLYRKYRATTREKEGYVPKKKKRTLPVRSPTKKQNHKLSIKGIRKVKILPTRLHDNPSPNKKYCNIYYDDGIELVDE